jgi:hypothetical protein
MKAQAKLSQSAGYLKMAKKLDKVGPRAHIVINMYQSTQSQIINDKKAEKVMFH